MTVLLISPEMLGFIRARFPSKTVLLGLTATLRKGKYKDNVLNFLGLDASKVHFIQRSNARRGVIFKVVVTG